MKILEETQKVLRKDLQEWILQNSLDVTQLSDDVYQIEGVGTFLLVVPKSLTPLEDDKNEVLLQDYKLLLDEFEQSLSNDDDINYLLFQFGTKFYYCKDIEPEFKLFKYLGKAKLQFPRDFPYLGIHGGYELGSGSRLYKDWCKKAKFLGISTLGICEENSLSGIVNFQYSCKKEGIRPIIGETVKVSFNDEVITLKIYPVNDNGFTNLIIINNTLNRDPSKTINIEDVITHSDDLFIILCTDVKLEGVLLYRFKKITEENRLFYQIDFREWGSDDRDLLHLENLKNYFDNYQGKVPPILITDSYYLDEEDSIIRKYLMKISDVGFKPQSDKQYFKSLDDVFTESLELFTDKGEVFLLDLIEESVENCNKIIGRMDFQLKTKGFQLPEYEMTEEEKKEYKNNEDLFFHLIEQNFQKKVIEKGLDLDVYMDRLELELDILQRGGFINYFLILWDVYRYCGEEGILVGLGRGSAAGSLVSYLLGVTGLDPIEYNLLFERFLNEARILKEEKVETIVLELDDKELKFPSHKTLYIKRGSEKMLINVKKLEEGDELISY